MEQKDKKNKTIHEDFSSHVSTPNINYLIR